jgi:predicted PurR-regulated permease PerM
MTSLPAGQSRPPVPGRTILATISLILAAALALYLVVETRRVLTWMVIAAFFAIALYPLAAWVQRRVLKDRWRALATFLVFLVVFLALGGLVTASPYRWSRRGRSSPGNFPT